MVLEKLKSLARDCAAPMLATNVPIGAAITVNKLEIATGIATLASLVMGVALSVLTFYLTVWKPTHAKKPTSRSRRRRNRSSR